MARGKCPEEGANRGYDSKVEPTEPPSLKSDRLPVVIDSSICVALILAAAAAIASTPHAVAFTKVMLSEAGSVEVAASAAVIGNSDEAAVLP